MSEYELTVTVEYQWKVTAASYKEAEAQGFDYQDLPNMATVLSIEAASLSTDDEDEEE